MKEPSICIIIVNWNAGQQLSECLVSIRDFGNGCVRSVIVVDNSSTDSSLVGLELFGLPLQIIRNTENRGFAAACNQGASVATGDYFLFLNPDTQLTENSLALPLAFMERPENAKAGICGIQLFDELGQVVRTCARFPTPGMLLAKACGTTKLSTFGHLDHRMIEWDHQDTREVDQVIGAFFLVRRCVWEDLNGLDERFFVYFEEVDFSLRACHAGWKTVYFAEAQAFHAGGGTSRQVKDLRLFYFLRSQLLYGRKQYSAIQLTQLKLITLLFEPVARMAHCLFQCSFQGILHTLRAYRLLYRSLPAILTM